MPDYALYLECGPQQKKTMVHVLELLGCISKGATMQSAMAETPPAIRKFHEFEARHSSQASPIEPITFHVAEHVTKGPWLGYGDPVSGFTPDFAALSSADLHVYLQRLRWMEEDILCTIAEIPLEKRTAIPAGGRAIHAILVNLAEGHAVFLRNLLGKMEEISLRMRVIRRDPAALPAALKEVWDISAERLAAMDEAERSLHIQHGQVTWTARRAMRRMLEHTWDLYNEMLAQQKQLPA